MVKTLLQIQATKMHGALLITAEVKNKVAYLAIDGYISRWGDASAKNLKNEVAQLSKDGATSAELYINTEGGDCFQANEIVNVLNDTFGVANVKPRVGSIAASAGSFILATYSKNASGKRNSQYMIHKPMGHFSGNAAKVKQEVQVLENLEDTYRDVYAEAFGMTPEAIDKKWDKGDWWLNSKQAKEIGLIATIEDADEEITPEARLRLVAAAAPHIPEEKTPKTEDMNLEALAVSLGLSKDATLAQCEAKATQLKTQADSAVSIQAKLDQQEKDTKANSIKAILDKAENVDKKITGEQRPMLEAMLDADMENGEKYIASLTVVDHIEVKPKPTNGVEISAAQKDWKYEDYLNAENGTELFAALEESDPELAEKLTNAHYA